jgi:hypothetical protein
VRSLRDARNGLASWSKRGGVADMVTWSKESFLGTALGPIEPGKVVMLAGRTNAGKSFAILHALAYANCPALYLSLEDSELEIARRCSLFPSSRLDDVMVATPRRRLSAVRGAIEEAAQEHVGGPWLVALDYAQLTTYDGTQPAWSGTDAIARALDELQELGKEHGFALLIASQVTRPPKPTKRDEGTGDPPLTLYDLKGSSTLEDYAYVVLLLNRNGKRVTIEVGKHKSAPTGARQTFERGEGGWLLPVALDDELP